MDLHTCFEVNVGGRWYALDPGAETVRGGCFVVAKIWASMVKRILKHRKPGFNKSYHGFRTFGQLLEEAQSPNLLAL